MPEKNKLGETIYRYTTTESPEEVLTRAEKQANLLATGSSDAFEIRRAWVKKNVLGIRTNPRIGMFNVVLSIVVALFTFGLGLLLLAAFALLKPKEDECISIEAFPLPDKTSVVIEARGGSDLAPKLYETLTAEQESTKKPEP